MSAWSYLSTIQDFIFSRHDAFPPAPSKSIDWSKLTSTVTEGINGHVESTYSVQTSKWSTPRFVADPYLRVHGLSPALNYGQQAYEGVKAYRDPNGQINIFRPSTHAARLSHSASYVSIPAIPESHFLACLKMAVAKNAELVPPHESNALLYIRPLVFGSSGHLNLTPPSEYTLAVYIQPSNSYHGVRPLDALVLENFDRAAPYGTGSAKVGGNYAPVVKWSELAKREGYGITLHLDAATRSEIEEFSTSGFLGVKKLEVDGSKQITIVVPNSGNIVQSVTSDSCCAIARSMGWIVEKRAILWSELSSFSEVMAVGTAASILPIKSITRKSTNEKFFYGEEPGDCTLHIGNYLKDVMTGRKEDTFNWLARVEEKDLSVE